MREQHPLAWVRRISEELIKFNEIPLFGNAPPFDVHNISKVFDIQGLKVILREQKWSEEEEIGAGLGPHLLVVPVTLSPLPHPLYWAMARKDIEKFTSWMLNGQADGKSFTSDILVEGFYRFLLLEALFAAQKLEPIQQMTLHLGDEARLPEERAFCIDVELSFHGQSCWGRLIATEGFRKNWIHHFSAFPAEYAPGHLSRKLEMIVGVKTGFVSLSMKEWKKLKKGDFLFLDQSSYDVKTGTGTASLMLGTKALFNVKIAHNNMDLIDYSFTQENTMQEENSTNPEAAEEESIAIKDLPLHVTVELARLKITFDKLMSLAPGNMLDLPIHPDQGVLLTIGGQKVGRGELVYLGETLGIRILEMG